MPGRCGRDFAASQCARRNTGDAFEYPVELGDAAEFGFHKHLFGFVDAVTIQICIESDTDFPAEQTAEVIC